MSDEPPAWMDDAPPASAGYSNAPVRSGPGGVTRQGGYDKPRMTPDEIAALAADFHAWIDSPDTRGGLKSVLPGRGTEATTDRDVDAFIATAKAAVMAKPTMLALDLRPSLLAAVHKASAQGLMPDGKQGAFVPRYNSDTRRIEIVWQPMVWGIVKLGRDTGAITSIRAHIVFMGEQFRVVAGEEDRIEHFPDIDIVEEAYQQLNGGVDGRGNLVSRPAEFFARVRAAYCLITGVDGTVTRRWMTKSRLVSLREASRATNGPWNSRWMDEMILKGVILYTAKHINLDRFTTPAVRFIDALETDMPIDFNGRDQAELSALDAAPALALAPPPTKLEGLEAALAKAATRQPEPVLAFAADQEVGTAAKATAEEPPVPEEVEEPTAEEIADLTRRFTACLAGLESATPEKVAKTTAGDRYRSLIKEMNAAGMFKEISDLGRAVFESMTGATV
jgi:recombinational DNA repair protein RecT